MPEPIPPMMHDDRPIYGIYWDDRDGSHLVVGEQEIEKITAYWEDGEMYDVPWLAVFIAGEIIYRVPSRQVMIRYVQAPKEAEASGADAD